MFARLHSYIGPIIVVGGTGFIIGTSMALSEYHDYYMRSRRETPKDTPKDTPKRAS